MFFETCDLIDDEIRLHLVRTADENPDKDYVPAYYFKIIRLSDQSEIGQCDLRVGHNMNTFYGGNIGYRIREQYRGHHYAGKACLLLIKLARKHNLGHLLITCAPENVASQKTCPYCGAVLTQILDLPEWHELYRAGRRKSMQYKITL